jgi:peptidoglycan/xylan/chitin deacetylase (PgdA/CDA1 family)
MTEAISFAWLKDNQAAVSLTYDDGLPIHYNLSGPLLERHNLRATFYPPIESDLRLHPDRWRELAAAGHELGNRTIFHPCRQTDPEPYPWRDERSDLAGYTLEQLRSSLKWPTWFCTCWTVRSNVRTETPAAIRLSAAGRWKYR